MQPGGVASNEPPFGSPPNRTTNLVRTAVNVKENYGPRECEITQFKTETWQRA